MEKIILEEKVFRNDWTIVRTPLIYGKNHSGRKSFPELIKEKLEKGEEYRVVDDQLRTPTYVDDLAKSVAAIIIKRTTGIFHISGKDVLTPYGLAIKTAEYLGLNSSLIKRVTATNFTQPAKRPPRTDFIIDKAQKELGYVPISFEEGLEKTFR